MVAKILSAFRRTKITLRKRTECGGLNDYISSGKYRESDGMVEDLSIQIRNLVHARRVYSHKDIRS